VAAVTSLTATGASVASANVGTAVITNGTVTALTATGASIASMNAGVALLTTATVTNLTATGASIASANVGTLALTRLDVAAASVASANAGVAVITTGTVTNLTSTSASIASMNAGVALLTTATVTNLTATGASVASANVGTAVITGLTVTGASIASVNAGVAVLSGNLTLNGGTANGVLYLNGSKAATSGSALTFDGTIFRSAQLNIGTAPNANSRPWALNGFGYISGASGNGIEMFNSSTSTYGYWTFESDNRFSFNAIGGHSWTAGGAEKMRVTGTVFSTDSSINVGIGTASPTKLLTVGSSTTANTTVRLNCSTTAGSDTGMYSFGIDDTNNFAGIKLDFSDRVAKGMQIFTDSGYSYPISFSTTGSQDMTLDASGNLGVGTTSQNERIRINSSTAAEARMTIAYNGTVITYFGSYSGIVGSGNADDTFLTTNGAKNLIFGTNSTERARITSGGDLLVGTTTNTSAYKMLVSGATNIIRATGNENTVANGNLLYLGSNTANNYAMTFGVSDTNNYTYLMSFKENTGASGEMRFYSYTTLNGRYTTAGNWYKGDNTTTWSTTSDRRIKENIESLNKGLDVINALRPVEFDYKRNKKHAVGFIAQEYELVLPEQVYEDNPIEDDQPYVDDGKVKVISENLVPYLVKAIQEQQAMIKSLEAKVAALESK